MKNIRNILVFLICICLSALCGCKNKADNINLESTKYSDNCNIKIEEQQFSDELFGSSEDMLQNIGIMEYKNINMSSYKPIKSTYGYESLSENGETRLYDLMKDNVYKISCNTDSSGYYNISPIVLDKVIADTGMVSKVFKAFKHDNPDVFWLSNSINFVKMKNKTVIKLKSVVSGEECKDIRRRLNSVLFRIFNAIPKGLSEYDREIYLHDLILNSCVYDREITGDQTWRSFTIIGALVDKRCVCEGYSKAMQYLLNNVGIECRLITGNKGKEHHMWNLVKINNNWYHLDATWDSSSRIGRYNYFNLNDEGIKYSRSIDGECNKICSLDRYNFKLPKCISMEENYFYKNAVRIDSFDKESDKKIVEKIKQVIAKKQRYLYIIINSKMDYNLTVKKLFYEQPYKFFEYLNEISKNSPYFDDLNMRKISFIENKAINALVVEMKYLKRL